MRNTSLRNSRPFCGVAAMLGLASCENHPIHLCRQSETPPPTRKQVKMAYIAKNTATPTSLHDRGVQARRPETGCEVAYVAPATLRMRRPTTLSRRRCSVALMYRDFPNSPDALNQVFKEAMDKGVTVICVDSDLTGNGIPPRRVCRLGGDPAVWCPWAVNCWVAHGLR